MASVSISSEMSSWEGSIIKWDLSSASTRLLNRQESSLCIEIRLDIVRGDGFILSVRDGGNFWIFYIFGR